MSQDDRFEKGMEKFKEVYCGDVVPIPRGKSDFFDLMIENLFCDVWTRPALSQRDRRMLMMGAICALGESMTFGIQAKAICYSFDAFRAKISLCIKVDHFSLAPSHIKRELACNAKCVH